MSRFSHFDKDGNAHMVDVGAKAETRRRALAAGRIHMRSQTLALIRTGAAAKGDVLGVARVAAIQGAKRTAELIPLCHPLPLSHLAVEFHMLEAKVLETGALEAEAAIECRVTAETHGRTGVEMEALTAVTVGLLTVYDMCKAVDRGMRIGEVRLLEKSGGRSGDYVAGGG